MCETGYSMYGKKSIIMYILYCSMHCVKRREKILLGYFFEKKRKNGFFIILLFIIINSEKTNKIDACCDSVAAPLLGYIIFFSFCYVHYF